MEPPYFYHQVRQSLGAALLEFHKTEEAELVYKKELESFPNNGWSLFDLYQSLKMQDKKEMAKQIHLQYEKAWCHADIELRSSPL